MSGKWGDCLEKIRDKMTIQDMHLASGSSAIKAYFDVLTTEGIVIKGFKVVQGPSGLFIGLPSQKGTGEKWWDMVTMPRVLKEQLTSEALPLYEKVKSLQIPPLSNEK